MEHCIVHRKKKQSATSSSDSPSSALKPSSSVLKTMSEAGLKPLEGFPGHEFKRWTCRCLKCDEIVEPNYAFVKKHGFGCRKCSGKKDKDWERIREDDAREVMIAARLEPMVPYPGSSTPWLCNCLKCGQTVEINYESVRQRKKKQGGCQYCVGSRSPIVKVYLIENKRLQALKIGVTGSSAGESRIEEHKKYGWRVIKVWDYRSESKALEIEKKVLDYWRKDLGAPEFLTGRQMPQGGRTETVSSSLVDVEATMDLVESLLSTK